MKKLISLFSALFVLLIAMHAQKPEPLLKAAVGQHGINLTWQLSPSQNVAYQQILRGSTSGSETPYQQVSSTTTQYFDTGVIGGKKYFYEIEACSSTACSGPTNEASATAAVGGNP